MCHLTVRRVTRRVRKTGESPGAHSASDHADRLANFCTGQLVGLEPIDLVQDLSGVVVRVREAKRSLLLQRLTALRSATMYAFR